MTAMGPPRLTRPAPTGRRPSREIFLDYFAEAGLAAEPTAFDGRSDYGPFIAAGIPGGGLFSGAEEIKTAEEAAVYGGTAGIAYDPCYHQVCDDFDERRGRTTGLAWINSATLRRTPCCSSR